MGQRGGGHGGGGGGGFRGGGGGVSGFRGGGGGGYVGGYRGGYGGYYGGYRGGYYGGYGYRGYWPGVYFGFGYGYPSYYGGYYGGYYNPYYYDPYYYDYGYAAPAYTYAPAQQPVVVNQTVAPAATSGSYYKPADFYLIAFKDHNIRAAQSYQVIADQIEWTPKEGGAVQRAPLSSVDKAFSAQINRDRRVKFDLP